MPERPFLKFYPQDWRGDQALRTCSLAARGLWLECMSIMHFAVPYGHLLINGKPVTETQLATLCGASQEQISALLAELWNAGVPSKTRNGVIYSRRMTRDEKKSIEAKKNGRLGGNPTLSSAARVNPQDKPPDNLRGQRLEPETKVFSSKEILNSVTGSLTGRHGGTWSREQKKSAWQSKISKEAQLTMGSDEYVRFIEAWANDEPWAKQKAEEIDKLIKARSAA